MKEGKNGRPLGESCVLAAVDSHKKQDFSLKSLLLGSRQQHQQDTQTHLGYYRNLVADVLSFFPLNALLTSLHMTVVA